MSLARRKGKPRPPVASGYLYCLERAAGWQRKAALFHRGSVAAREAGDVDNARWKQTLARRAFNDSRRWLAVAEEFRIEEGL